MALDQGTKVTLGLSDGEAGPGHSHPGPTCSEVSPAVSATEETATRSGHRGTHLRQRPLAQRGASGRGRPAGLGCLAEELQAPRMSQTTLARQPGGTIWKEAPHPRVTLVPKPH